jgi:type II secretory pathway pseudopilin PulG
MRDGVILSPSLRSRVNSAKDLLLSSRKSRFFGLRPQNDAQSGFTYLTVLFVVAFMGIGLALTGELWHTAVTREKEAQLLHVGNQYRHAIARYYASGPRQYPRTLEDLLKDPRKPNTERHLRKLYFDPITGKNDWGQVKGPDGGIMGVYSSSAERPFKTAGFGVYNKEFEGAGKYSDWKFVYAPAAAQVPGQVPPQPLRPTAPGVP